MQMSGNETDRTAVLSDENDEWFRQFLRDHYDELAGKYYALGYHEIVAAYEDGWELRRALHEKGKPFVICGYCPRGVNCYRCGS